MDITYINAVVLPLFATWFLPVSIRDRKTGKYLGIVNKRVAGLVLLLLCIETVLVVQQHGVSSYSMNSIALYVAMPIVGAFVFVKYTHKELFGNEIKFTKWW